MLVALTAIVPGILVVIPMLIVIVVSLARSGDYAG